MIFNYLLYIIKIVTDTIFYLSTGKKFLTNTKFFCMMVLIIKPFIFPFPLAVPRKEIHYATIRKSRIARLRLPCHPKRKPSTNGISRKPGPGCLFEISAGIQPEA